MKHMARMYPLLLLAFLILLTSCEWLFVKDDEVPAIQILNPTSHFSWVTTAETIDLSGSATDVSGIKSVRIKVNGGNPVEAVGTNSWSISDIPLLTGENTIVCEARDKRGNVNSDTLYVTRNTTVEFSGIPYFSVSNFFAGQPNQTVVRQTISSAAKGLTSVRLVRLNSDFTVASEIGNLVDNGSLWDFDEISGDGVFSGFLTIEEENPGRYLYRVVAVTDGDVANYSPMFEINVFDPIAQDHINAIINNNANLSTVLNQSTADNLSEAIDVLADWYINQPGVASVKKVDGYLEITYTSGLVGGVIFSETDANGLITTLGNPLTTERLTKPTIPETKQTRGSYGQTNKRTTLSWNQTKVVDEHTVQDKDVLIWQPYKNALAFSYNPEIDAVFTTSDLDLNVVQVQNNACTINSLANLTEYGTVIFMTHGIGGEHILTGEAMNSTNVWDYLGQILNGEIGFFENITYNNVGGFAQRGTVYSVTSKWISKLSGTFPNSIIFNGSCQSSMTAKLQTAFSGKGAKAYLAFSKIVTARFAKEKCLQYFQKMAVELKNNGQAFVAGTDPYYHLAAAFTMSGDADLHYSYDLINGDFEFGNLNGWTRNGDGRVITQLAGIMPTQGNFMGIISTGLGFTASNGSIAQSFKVPDNISTLNIKWNFMSEEFMEWVGSQYQDYLKIEIRDSLGTYHVLFYETIDSFVGYELESISPPVMFDHGDVYGTGWRTLSSDITQFRGQVVRLVISIGDVGDSAYDSACLLDEIHLE